MCNSSADCCTGAAPCANRAPTRDAILSSPKTEGTQLAVGTKAMCHGLLPLVPQLSILCQQLPDCEMLAATRDVTKDLQWGDPTS